MPEKLPSPDLTYDAASILDVGRRDHQEDALATDFPQGGGLMFAVLSDGMGGHAAGDVASKIVVTEIFSELKFQSTDPDAFIANIGDALHEAALSANACIKAHAEANPDTTGMGATLVAPIIWGSNLFWISVGDSPLYLFRSGALWQLNEDHSLAPQIDYMVDAGLMEAEAGRNHPDRNCLTSVLIGRSIEKIDCPSKPLKLRADDILIVASDGIQTLGRTEIEEILTEGAADSAAAIARSIVEAIGEADHPEQDNVSLCVIRVSDASADAGLRETNGARILPLATHAAASADAQSKPAAE